MQHTGQADKSEQKDNSEQSLSRAFLKQFQEKFLAGLQSNSSLWIDDVRPSVNIWLTSVFKFVLGHINQYRLDTLHGNRP